MRSALQNLLANLLMRQGLQRFVLETLTSLNHAVGDAWMRGELAVFEEHLYTEQLQVALRTGINAFPRQPGAPRVLLTTFPGEQHGLGLLMVEALLVPEGAQCISLGAQTPIEDIRRAALAHEAHIVALVVFGGVSRAAGGRRARDAAPAAAGEDRHLGGRRDDPPDSQGAAGRAADSGSSRRRPPRSQSWRAQWNEAPRLRCGALIADRLPRWPLPRSDPPPMSADDNAKSVGHQRRFVAIRDLWRQSVTKLVVERAYSMHILRARDLPQCSARRCIIRPCQEMNKGAKWAALPNLRGLSVFSPRCSWRCRPALRSRRRDGPGRRAQRERRMRQRSTSTSRLPPSARTGRHGARPTSPGPRWSREKGQPGSEPQRHVQRVLSSIVFSPSQPAGTSSRLLCLRRRDAADAANIGRVLRFLQLHDARRSCCRVSVPTEPAPRRRSRRWSRWRPRCRRKGPLPWCSRRCSSRRPADSPFPAAPEDSHRPAW